MFKIGEFSKLAQVSIHLLRHYDRIGLFMPIKIDDFSGYRYYSAHQLPHLNQILALREMGISLEQISKILEKDVSTDEIQSMLRLRAAQTEHTLAKEEARLHLIQSRIEMLSSQEDDVLNYPVLVKHIPQQQFLSIREIAPSLDSMGNLFSLVHEAVSRAGINEVTYCQSITHSEHYAEHDIDWELGFNVSQGSPATVSLADGRHMTLDELKPIEQAATLVYSGSWLNAVSMFQMAGKWIEVNQFQIIGPFREVYLSLTPSNEAEVVFELQIPVSKKEST